MTSPTPTPRPPTADYDHYYQQLAKYGGPTGTGAGQNPADQQRLEQLADRLENLLPGKDAAILDIGCGAGGLLQALHTRGYTRAEGLDPDPAAVAAARARGLPVRTGLATESPTLYAGRRFDLIVLSHVAEHLRNLDWLDNLPRLLDPRGTLYVEVPAPRPRPSPNHRVGGRHTRGRPKNDAGSK